MERPSVVKTRARYRSGFSSEQMNLYRNQYLYDLNRLFSIFTEHDRSIQDNLIANIDSTLGDPITVNINGATKNFIDLHTINKECERLLDTAKFLLRSL